MYIVDQSLLNSSTKLNASVSILIFQKKSHSHIDSVEIYDRKSPGKSGQKSLNLLLLSRKVIFFILNFRSKVAGRISHDILELHRVAIENLNATQLRFRNHCGKVVGLKFLMLQWLHSGPTFFCPSVSEHHVRWGFRHRKLFLNYLSEELRNHFYLIKSV